MIIPHQPASLLLDGLNQIVLCVEVTFFIWIIARYIRDELLGGPNALPPDRKTPP